MTTTDTIASTGAAALPDMLRAVMQTIPRMQEVTQLGQLVDSSGNQRRFIARPNDAEIRVRVADQFDLGADAFVRDGELGSFGIVHLVSSQSDIAAELRKRIDAAAFLRHLMIEDLRPGAPEMQKSPYSVEVVFVVMPDQHGFATDLGDVLRAVLRSGSYLHALGVNVWRPPDSADAEKAATAARRAFAWLLPETERWFARPPKGSSVFDAPQSIELNNVRIPGQRTIGLDDTHPLHVVHGHNGSGKSSLVEALELVMTGKVQRLFDPAIGAHRSHDILTSRETRATGGATVKIQFASREPMTWTVGSDGVAVDDSLKIHTADAFRLDQTVADRLTYGTPAERALLLLGAFFPDESRDLGQRNERLRNAKADFARLPDRLKRQIGQPVTEGGVPELDALRVTVTLPWAAKGQPITWETFLALLPISREQVVSLGAILPRDVGERYERKGDATSADIEAAAKAFDDAFTRLGNDLNRTVETVDRAVRVLERHADGVIAGAAPAEDLETVLREWQGLYALADLLEREDQIAGAIQDARAGKHVFEVETQPLLATLTSVPSDGTRQATIAYVKNRRDGRRDALAKLTSTMQPVTAAARGEAAAGEEDAFDALTSAATLGVFGEEWKRSQPTLGQALRDANARGAAVEVTNNAGGKTHVGDTGWGRVLLEQARRVRSTLNDVVGVKSELPSPTQKLEGLVAALQKLHDACSEIDRANREAVNVLRDIFQRDGNLRRALNEVTALLTPARWAYADVIPSADLEGDRESLELQADELKRADGSVEAVAARFLLNTAELNTLALGIFLLCARRVKNPLRILVLDDPLQNMDELTVTTIARGLGRILRVWQRQLDPGWRVLLLLHAEDDVERIRSEVPCTAYFLPWLSPTDSRIADAPIRRNESRIKTEIQSLQELIRIVPPRA